MKRDKRIQAKDGVDLLLDYLTHGRPDDLPETSERVVKAFEEMLSGYKVKIPSLFKMFESPSDEMVVCSDIEFVSVCEHHLLPFVGVAHVGYLPGDESKVIGLSKIARLVDAFSRRLQLQERLTSEIATSLMAGVNAKGVGVVMVAKHQCLSCRGARKADAKMKTSSMLGYFRSKAEVRAEFLTLIGI